MHKTLLDLGRVPTLDELRAFFRDNDFSAAAYMNIDYSKMPNDTIEDLEYAKKMLDEHWEPLSHQMGLETHSSNYGKDNPLIAMRDNFENLVASGVYKLLEEQPETAEAILADFINEDGEFTVDGDDFLHNAVETAMKTMSYEEVAAVIQDTPAHEDFNPYKKDNKRAIDFDRQWNHTRTQIQTISMQDLVDEDGNEREADTAVTDFTDEIHAELQRDTFWASITEDDKKLLRMRMDGLTQEEIAKRLGYKTHSAVTKRIHKLKKIFENCA